MWSPSDIVDALRKLEPEELARTAAFLIAPTLVLLLAHSDLPRLGLAVELERPLALSKLKTSISPGGSRVAKDGLVVILEPSANLDYRIPLEPGEEPELWTSLTQDQLLANADRIALDAGGVSGEAPLLGVAEPIVMVIPSALEGTLQLPGRTEDIGAWRLASRRSISVLSGVLGSCVFGLAVAMTLAFPRKRKSTETLK